jgi:hypothetical protein
MKKGLGLFVLLSIFLVGFANAATLTLSDPTGNSATVSIADAENIYSYEVVLNYTGTITVGSITHAGFLGTADVDAVYSYNLQEGNLIYLYGSMIDPNSDGVDGAGTLFTIPHLAGQVTLWSFTAISSDDVGSLSDGNLTSYYEEAEPYCGDNSCGTGENCASCAADCGSCPASVGGGGGGGATVTQYYSIKVITPGEIVISDKNYIEVPLSITNNGLMELQGVSLSAEVTFEGVKTEDMNAILARNYIDKIASGQSENLSVRINVNTKKFGRYKLTIFADVQSPKISDFGDFYIELKKVEASEAEQNMIFAEKLINKNPACLELTEVIREAKRLFEEGDFRGSVVKLKEAVDSCTQLVSENEKSFVAKKSQTGLIFMVITLTFAILILGLILYIYRKAKSS